MDLGPTFHFTHPQQLRLTTQNLVCVGSIRQFAERARETAPSEVWCNQGARHLGRLLVDQGTSWWRWHHDQQCWGVTSIVPVRYAYRNVLEGRSVLFIVHPEHGDCQCRRGVAVQITGFWGPDYVAYIFVFLGTIIICWLNRLTLSDHIQVTLQLGAIPFDLVNKDF